MKLCNERPQIFLGYPVTTRTVPVEIRGAARLVTCEGQEKPRIAVLHDCDAFQAAEERRRPREGAEIVHAQVRPLAT